MRQPNPGCCHTDRWSATRRRPWSRQRRSASRWHRLRRSRRRPLSPQMRRTSPTRCRRIRPRKDGIVDRPAPSKRRSPGKLRRSCPTARRYSSGWGPFQTPWRVPGRAAQTCACIQASCRLRWRWPWPPDCSPTPTPWPPESCQYRSARRPGRIAYDCCQYPRRTRRTRSSISRGCGPSTRRSTSISTARSTRSTSQGPGSPRVVGGTSVLALPSRARDGSSRILAMIAPPHVVTVAGSDLDYVVTEHGVAHLTGLTAAERAEALILVADPQDRAALAAAAVNPRSGHHRR
jgi:hypothetical protein